MNSASSPMSGQPSLLATAISDSSHAVLVVNLADLTVRQATPTAIAWLGLPPNRLLGRSLLLSLPHLGQALAVTVSGGLRPLPEPLAVDVAKPDHTCLSVYVRRLDSDAILEFHVADAHDPVGRARLDLTTLHDPALGDDALARQQRLSALRDEISALRIVAETRARPLASETPLRAWLGQAETALTRLVEHSDELAELVIREEGPSTQADRL